MENASLSAPNIDRETLARVVARAWGVSAIEINDWSCQPFSRQLSNPATGGLVRLSGLGRAQGRDRPWSLVLKVAALDPDAPEGWGAESDHFGYWKREVLAYRSGFLNHLPGMVRAPRCYEVQKQADGSYYLWLEEIQEPETSAWSLPQYGRAARHFGQLAGSFLAGRRLPTFPWLRSGWLRSWTQHFEFLVGYAARRDLWDHPDADRLFPTPIFDRLLQLWEDRERWMDALDAQPQTLCHFDVWRPNMFRNRAGDGGERTIAIDWQSVGLGPAGEIGNLVMCSLMNLDVAADDAADLDTLIWENYLLGLRETGWRGDSCAVRFCYTAYPALRWGWVFPTLMVLPALRNPRKREETEIVYGRPVEQVLEQWAKTCYLLLDFADEARSLYARLR